MDGLEVGAGAEHGRRPGEHGDPDVLVGLGGVDRRLDALSDLGAHCVARLRPVDRDDRDMVIHVVGDAVARAHGVGGEHGDQSG